MSSSRLPLALLAAVTLLIQGGGPARASEMGSIVQAYCLAAVEEEMTKAGKVAPQGMAAYACRCVVDRLTQGTSLGSARSYCKESTARRYAL
ncbi:MAG: hypothetical protein VKN83_04410 [Cyanobacteriota bacterium]|jgi:hypothetical protein|nr:hypothetical protein [Cyanobacteriota bacterium]